MTTKRPEAVERLFSMLAATPELENANQDYKATAAYISQVEKERDDLDDEVFRLRRQAAEGSALITKQLDSYRQSIETAEARVRELGAQWTTLHRQWQEVCRESLSRADEIKALHSQSLAEREKAFNAAREIKGNDVTQRWGYDDFAQYEAATAREKEGE